MDDQNRTRELDLPPTESLCPQCFERIPAYRVRENGDVYLIKTCPEHGQSRTIIWRGAPDYGSWSRTKPLNRPSVTQTGADRGCPLDCGLCPRHAQQTCCVLLELTARCDLGCPVCFASSGETSAPDPGLDEIESWLRLLKDDIGFCNIQLSGGEPTMRDDLPQIIAIGRDMGFSFFQLNTNGLRLAAEPGYAGRLREAGLSTVFLQFDGVDDDVYLATRGAELHSQKEAAVTACAEAGLGIVLVPTLVPGVNTDQIGQIIDYALRRLPHVRGVHFQPISYFGRYPEAPSDGARYTLPELMRDIEMQTNGRIPADSLYPSGCGHSLCSVSGDYLLLTDGTVRTLTDRTTPRSCCGGGENTAGGEATATQGSTVYETSTVKEPRTTGQKNVAERPKTPVPTNVARWQNPIESQRRFIARRWSLSSIPAAQREAADRDEADTRKEAAAAAQSEAAIRKQVTAASHRDPENGATRCCCSSGRSEENVMSLDDFLERVRGYSFTITAMAFQDIWTLDLERLQNCHLHVVAPGGRIVPFCAYNLTDADGTPLHRPVRRTTQAEPSSRVGVRQGPYGRSSDRSDATHD